MAMLITKGRIGLYQHPNDTSTLGAAGPEAMWPPGQHRGVNPDGSGQLVGEVGDVIPVDPEYRAYFGGSYPPEGQHEGADRFEQWNRILYGGGLGREARKTRR